MTLVWLQSCAPPWTIIYGWKALNVSFPTQLEVLNLDLCSSRYLPLKWTCSGCLVLALATPIQRWQREWCANGRLERWLVRHWAFGSLVGAPMGVWQPGWHQNLVPGQTFLCGVGNAIFELATPAPFLPWLHLLLGCVALATPILSWQRQLLFFQGQA